MSACSSVDSNASHVMNSQNQDGGDTVTSTDGDWLDSRVRTTVVELLREMSQSKLAAICPLSQVTLVS